MTVRFGIPADEPELLRLCHSLYGENALFTMDDDLVREMLWRAFRKQDGIVGVIGEPAHLEGMILMLISRFWYSRERHLEELLMFVDPAHRKTAHAKSLIGFAKSCSDTLQIPLNIGVLSNERTEAKLRLYQRQLGKPAGAFFFFNGQFAHGPAAAGI